MSKPNGVKVSEMSSSRKTTFTVSFPIELNIADGPDETVEKIDVQVNLARQEIVKRVFASRGIKVQWSN